MNTLVLSRGLQRNVLEFAPTLPAFYPKTRLGKVIRDCLPHLPRELALELLDRVQSVGVIESRLSVVVFRACEVHGRWDCACLSLNRRTEDYGVVSRRVATAAGVAYIVDAFQNSVELELIKPPALGTSAAAEGAG